MKKPFLNFIVIITIIVMISGSYTTNGGILTPYIASLSVGSNFYYTGETGSRSFENYTIISEDSTYWYIQGDLDNETWNYRVGKKTSGFEFSAAVYLTETESWYPYGGWALWINTTNLQNGTVLSLSGLELQVVAEETITVLNGTFETCKAVNSESTWIVHFERTTGVSVKSNHNINDHYLELDHSEPIIAFLNEFILVKLLIFLIFGIIIILEKRLGA